MRDDHPGGASVVVSVRVSVEQHHQLLEAAASTGHDVSGYVRETIVAGTELTATALDATRLAERQRVHAETRFEMRALRDRCARAESDATAWEQRALRAEGELVITSQRLLGCVRSVLWSAKGARADLQRLWTCLPPDDQERIFPVLATDIVERLGRLDERAARSYRRGHLPIATNAIWLNQMLLGVMRDGGTSRARDAGLEIALAAIQFEAPATGISWQADGAAPGAFPTPLEHAAPPAAEPGPEGASAVTACAGPAIDNPGEAAFDVVDPIRRWPAESGGVRVLIGLTDRDPIRTVDELLGGVRRASAGRASAGVRADEAGSAEVAPSGEVGSRTPTKASTGTERRLPPSEAWSDMWLDLPPPIVAVISPTVSLIVDPALQIADDDST